jgi:amino acid transporter
MPFSLAKLFVGRPIANREAESRKLGVFTGLPAMGLDGLGSASYGPEAALTILAVTGPAGLGAIGMITWIILILLAILFFSYWQTIAAYPNNGGSYVVAKDNLGGTAGLMAAAALMVDYLLNVAVGISAGVGALPSAIPVLQSSTLWLCLGILAVITIMNLRGTRESGLAWAVPTYLFAASLGLVLAWGTFQAMAYGGHPQPVIAPPQMPRATEALTLWLLLRAFASGCTAMTGVEAVSNGVNAFREPKVRHAHGTLAAIVVILGLLLLGIAHVAQAYGTMAMDQTKEGYQSVLSQIVGAVYGRGLIYYVTIGSVLAVLCLSANTSFVGFPRLCHRVAEDGFLPRPFAVPGRRLVYSVGVLCLAAGAGGLLTAFGGITDRLIPLFAVGAFLSFTLSQAGMAVHWWRGPQAADGRWGGRTNLAKLAINGIGAAVTGLALVIILGAKFLEGAWLTVLIIPSTIFLLLAVRQYYDGIDRQVLQDRHRCIDLRDLAPPLVLVPIKRWDRLARKAVEYALRLSPDVTVLHVTAVEGPDGQVHEQTLRDEWRECVEEPARRLGVTAPRLTFVGSEFRSMTAPLLRAIQAVQRITRPAGYGDLAGTDGWPVVGLSDACQPGAPAAGAAAPRRPQRGGFLGAVAIAIRPSGTGDRRGRANTCAGFGMTNSLCACNPLAVSALSFTDMRKEHAMAETNRTSADDAIANAVYNATGHRIRHLPMTPDRLLNVL